MAIQQFLNVRANTAGKATLDTGGVIKTHFEQKVRSAIEEYTNFANYLATNPDLTPEQLEAVQRRMAELKAYADEQQAKADNAQYVQSLYNIDPKDTAAFTWAYLNSIGGVFLDFAPLESGYAFGSINKAPFSPLNKDLTSPDNLLIGAMLLAMRKDPKAIAALAGKYLDSQAEIATAIAKMGNQSWMHSSLATMLLSGYLHSNGHLADVDTIRVQEHVRSVFDKSLVKEYVFQSLNAVTTLVDGTSSSREMNISSKGQSAIEKTSGLMSLVK